jgi:fructuronate reductase
VAQPAARPVAEHRLRGAERARVFMAVLTKIEREELSQVAACDAAGVSYYAFVAWLREYRRAGYRSPTIAETVADPVFAGFVRRLWRDEVIPALDPPPGVDLHAYADRLFDRYANPGIRHRTWQIAMDGSQKLPQRILGTLADSLAQGRDCPGLIVAVAAWMRYVGGVDEGGAPIDVRDPMAARLRAVHDTAQTPADAVAALLSLREVFPEPLAKALGPQITVAYSALLAQGARRSVEALA